MHEELLRLAGEFSITLIAEKIDRQVPAGVEAIEISAWSVFPWVNPKLAQLLRTFSLVHCHDSLGFMRAAATSQLSYVVTCHGIAPLRLHGSIRARSRGAVTLLTYPNLYRSATLVIGISAYVTAWLREFARVEAVTVANGAPKTMAFRYETPSRRNLLYVGEVSYRKGVHDLVRALSTTSSDVQLDVVGRGASRSYVDRLDVKGLEERVRFHGEVSDLDLRNLYRSCFSTCSASYWEGFGLPIVEGFSQGRPAIVRRVGGMSELIGESGAGCALSDFGKLNSCVEFVTDEWAVLSARAVAYAQTHSWDSTFDTYLRIFRDQVKR